MDESGYQKMIQNYRQVASFFQDKNILRINPIDSIWKSKNTILKLDCDDGRLYLFKRISEDSEISEIAKAAKLAQEYPVLFPQIFIVDRNAYLMEFIEGRTFFTLAREEMVPFSSQCGKILQETWSGDINGIKGLERKEPERKDLRGIIRDSFGQRRKKAARFFSQDELADYDFSPFASVPERQSHNDLNAANLFYVSGAAAGIRMIDPQELGFNDIARDIGRYCASTFLIIMTASATIKTFVRHR